MISICLQTSNSQCNLLQGWLGFFMRSACVPEKVVEVFAHAGLSISLTSIHNAVSSISREISSKIKREVRTLQAGFAYDNFNIQFKAAQPTLEHRGSFMSTTSATVIPLYGINDNNVDALRSSAQLWDRDSHNPSPLVLPVMTEWRSFLRLHKNNAYSRQTHPVRLSPRQEAFSWHVRAILVNQVKEFKHFKKELDEPDTVKRIPVHKTKQIPCRAMDIKQSTTDGNVQVLDNLFRQGGIGDPRDSGFDAEHDVDMSEHIMLIHGDLLTKEQRDTVRNSRCIEHTPKNCFQYVIFLPGLFHYKMACADAIWRTYVQPKEGCDDENSLYQHTAVLWPEETGKMVSKPGFRRVHDVIHHDIWASMMDCWWIEAENENREWNTLETFAASEPTWDDMVAMSHTIVRKYIATMPGLDEARAQPSEPIQ
jgi:hypothetical protein